MPQYNAGNAYLQILPSFRGIERLMQRETAKLAREIDKSIAQGANDGLLRAFNNVDPDKVAKTARESGDKWASVFESTLGRHLKDAADSLPEFEPKVKLSRFDRAIKQTKRQLSDLANAKVGPTGDVGLDELGSQLDAISRRMIKLADETKNFDQRMRLLSTAGQSDMLRDLVSQARDQGLTDGRAYGGAFGDAGRRAIQKALGSLPEVNLEADASPAERAVAALREQLIALGEKRIGIDIDRDRFAAEMSYITAQLQSLARDPKSISLKFDLDEATEGLKKFTDQAVPEAEKSLAKIRADMAALGDKTVGVDVRADVALAQIAALHRRLEDLDNDDVDIHVRTGAAMAAAELAMLERSVKDSALSMRSLGQEAGITMSRIGYLVAIGASIGSLIAPAAATAAVAIAGLGTAAASAALGLGVLGLGLFGVGDAVQKMSAYQQDADKSSRSFSQAQNRVTTALQGVRNAQTALADARQDAGEQATRAAERIAEAERDVGKARRDAARGIKEAREREKEAIQDVARAREDARQQVLRAIETVQDAERGLTRANADQATARRELNEALRDAVRDLRALDTAVKRNGNEIDQATTASMKAKLELDKILTNPRATEIEKRMARESYEDRLIQIEELKGRQEELRQQQVAAAKSGVESTDRVKKARETLANADERALDAARRLRDAQAARARAERDAVRTVAQAQKRVADAQEAVTRAQVDGAERVHDAERAVSQARQSAATQARNSARQIQSAQQRVIDSQRALQQSTEGLGVAGGDAFDNMNDALNNLSPAGQRFAKFLFGLKPELDRLRATAQAGLLPGLQDSIQILVDEYFPAFDRFVGKIARGMGDMFRATARVLTMPEWRQFFGFLDEHALPSLQGMWIMSLNLARGIANIVRALHPLSGPMGQGLVDLSERFAQWSDSLDTNRGFQDFMAYAARVGPQVVRLIEQMGVFLYRMVVAAAPIGEVILKAVLATFEWINSWDIDTLTAVLEIVTVLGVGILALTGFVRAVKFVTEVWTAVSLVAAKAQSLLAAAVVRYNTATVTATASTGLLNGRLFATAGAGAAGAAGMGAMTAAAGPLGLALLGIGAIWYLNHRKMQKANEATDELVGGFQELGKTYKAVQEGAETSGTAISDTFKRVTENNGDMQSAVVTLTQMGASLDDIAAAAGGSTEKLNAMMDLIDKRIEQLSKEKNQHFFDIFDNEKRDDEQERLFKLKERLEEAAGGAQLASDAMKILNGEEKNVAASTQLLTPAQQALADAHEVLGDKSATAQQKMDALTKAQDAVRQSGIDAIEAEESWEASLDSLTESVNAAKDAHDKDAKSLSVHTGQGRSNRDMLEQLIQSADRMYDADVALNGVTQQAITKGQGHYTQIRNVARALGLSKTETDKLIAAYGKVPKDIKTAVSMDPNSFNNVYNNLRRMLFMQDAAKKGLSPGEAERQWKVQEGQRLYRRYVPNAPAGYYAEGGPIQGVGGPTEDANLIWASKGEFMQPAHAVDYYGPGFMEAIRQRAIPKDMFPGFATGGAIGARPNWKWPIQYKVPELDIPTDEEIFSNVYSGLLGDMKGGQGWKWMVNAVRSQFPGTDVYSTFRRGSRTLSGNLSYHARGRAVDFEPDREVAEWLARTFGKNTLELITPWRDLMLWHGKPHKYGRDIEAQHGVFGKNRHIHWAYDQGGYLPPGYSTVFNGTGRPEPVLTAPQWDAVIQGGGDNGRPGDTYNIEFAENKLTIADLDAHQRRRDTLARTGRPR